jgi:hypothetical protein
MNLTLLFQKKKKSRAREHKTQMAQIAKFNKRMMLHRKGKKCERRLLVAEFLPVLPGWTGSIVLADDYLDQFPLSCCCIALHIQSIKAFLPLRIFSSIDLTSLSILDAITQKK